MRLKYKLLWYIAAWLLALFATNPDGELWGLAWMFPLGLVAVFDVHLANDGGWGYFIGACLVYIAHGWFYFRSKQIRATWIWFAVLIVIFIGNVQGCRTMIHGH